MDGNHCILGHKIKYLRRKSTANCSLPYNLPPMDSKKDCICGRGDYSCDKNFFPDRDEVCRPIENYVPSKEPPSPCYDKYWVPTGYRKLAGDTCIKGLDLNPKEVSCSAGSYLFSFLYYGVLLLVVAALGMLVCSRLE